MGRFVEKRMVTDETDEVEFDDICPPEKTKKSVACQAFVSGLLAWLRRYERPTRAMS
jgi:hypothetical protein